MTLHVCNNKAIMMYRLAQNNVRMVVFRITTTQLLNKTGIYVDLVVNDVPTCSIRRNGVYLGLYDVFVIIPV
jgi:hypothetical protein